MDSAYLFANGFACLPLGAENSLLALKRVNTKMSADVSSSGTLLDGDHPGFAR